MFGTKQMQPIRTFKIQKVSWDGKFTTITDVLFKFIMYVA